LLTEADLFLYVLPFVATPFEISENHSRFGGHYLSEWRARAGKCMVRYCSDVSLNSVARRQSEIGIRMALGAQKKAML
jgi:hypothetical protein